MKKESHRKGGQGRAGQCRAEGSFVFVISPIILWAWVAFSAFSAIFAIVVVALLSGYNQWQVCSCEVEGRE